MFFDEYQIEKLEKIYRVNLMNSCSGYKSANLIGTISKNGQYNLAVFSSIVHLGSNPPLLGFFLRPTEIVPRHTYLNIKETEFYTINSIDILNFEKSHQTSAKYPRDVSEFDITGMKPKITPDFLAPFVDSSSIKIGMKFVEEIKVKHNRSRLIVGKIVSLDVKDEMLNNDGFIDLYKSQIATISGCDGYSFPETNERKGYQKPRKIQ